MHACGNDYIYVFGDLPHPEKFAVEASRRRFSIGADGLVLLSETEDGDKTMRIFNADGSSAKICGNALKCSAYLFSMRMGEKRFFIHTLAGRREVIVDGDRASVRFPIDGITAKGVGRVVVGNVEREYDEINVGNAHRVFFCEPTKVDLTKYGKIYNGDDSANADFVKVENPVRLRLRFYERGSGETLSCGSGTIAAFYAATKRGYVASKVRAISDGGEQTVELDSDSITLTSQVFVAYRGEYEYRI
jgi:diaminopimelate epimerase